MIRSFYIFISGLLMGIADTMPGISGSTITYILGVYEDFINALSNLLKRGSFSKSFIFLVKMGLGWSIGAAISIVLISNFVNNNIYFITSLFLGLVLMSVPITFKEAFGSYKIEYKKLIYSLLGFLLVIGIFIIGENLTSSISISDSNILYPYIFIVAMLAISSMLLPGISGSTILLIFGLYYPLINTLNLLLIGQGNSFVYIIIFILGAITGLFTVAKILSKIFKNYKTNTIYFIEGLLIGSIIPIINAPLSLEEFAYQRLSLVNFEFIPFIIGILVLLLLTNLKKIEKRAEDE